RNHRDLAGTQSTGLARRLPTRAPLSEGPRETLAGCGAMEVRTGLHGCSGSRSYVCVGVGLGRGALRDHQTLAGLDRLACDSPRDSMHRVEALSFRIRALAG